jgi:hypothetical protein
MQRQRLGAALVARYRAAAPDAAHLEVIKDLQDRIRIIGAECANKAQMHYFGSFASGFCTRDSDADLAYTFRSYDVLLTGQPRFDDQNSRRLGRFSQAAVEGGMGKVRFIDCRIPVVSFEDNASDVQCDVTVGNVGGVQNSKILRLVHDVHPIIAMYVHTVKAWAKAKEVIAPEKSTFNSFTVTTMALMVLQELGVLPVFNRPTGACGELTHADVELALAGFALPRIYADLDAASDAKMGEALTYLLQCFAQYYAAFDFKAGTVSLICPRRVRGMYREVADYYMKTLRQLKLARWEAYHKENKLGPIDPDELAQAMHSEEIQRISDTPVVVEDFVNFVNCGRRLTPHRSAPVFAEFGRLRDAMANPELDADELMLKLSRFNNTHQNATADARVRKFGAQ